MYTAEVDYFTNLFGSSYNSFTPDTSVIFSRGLYLSDRNELNMMGVDNYDGGANVNDTVYGNNKKNYLIYLNGVSEHNFGSFMVRSVSSSVPEPSIAILMASGLIAFGAVRRKARI